MTTVEIVVEDDRLDPLKKLFQDAPFVKGFEEQVIIEDKSQNPKLHIRK